MNEIPLYLIKPSPNPIRKTWDEQKMQELAQSIKEQGVIVPIKVRPSDDIEPCRVHGWNGVDGEGGIDDRGTGFTCEGCLNAIVAPDELEDWLEDGLDPRFEVVYGHRRVEAARRAGLDEIPAIVEGLTDFNSLSQQYTENAAREKVVTKEDAEGFVRMLKHPENPKPHNISYLSRYTGVGRKSIERAIDYKKEVDALHKSGLPSNFDKLGVHHVLETATALGDDVTSKAEVLKKAETEDLTYKETRQVADAIAETPELKQAILETSGKLGDADRITQVAQMKMAGRALSDDYEERKREAFQEYDQAVKDFIDAVKLFDRMIKMARNANKFGKFSPEGKRFVVRRIDNLIDELEALRSELDEE